MNSLKYPAVSACTETGLPSFLPSAEGIDSMCMADLFLRAGLHFAVAHCNFHLRGEESDADEALVRDWAASAGIRFHHRDFDTAAFAAQSGQSIEMAARELRYRWFSQPVPGGRDTRPCVWPIMPMTMQRHCS